MPTPVVGVVKIIIMMLMMMMMITATNDQTLGRDKTWTATNEHATNNTSPI
jgi:hypothetical protein